MAKAADSVQLQGEWNSEDGAPSVSCQGEAGRQTFGGGNIRE
jgi:hypothetical protein